MSESELELLISRSIPPDSTTLAPVLPLSDLNIDDLPEGYEAARTAEGIPYFINHFTKQTSWVNPKTNKPSVASTQGTYLIAQLKKTPTSWSRRNSWQQQSNVSSNELHAVSIHRNSTSSVVSRSSSRKNSELSVVSMAFSTASSSYNQSATSLDDDLKIPTIVVGDLIDSDTKGISSGNRMSCRNGLR
jgi:WW domain